MRLAALALLLAAVPAAALSADTANAPYPEARPFPNPNAAPGEIAMALLSARSKDHRVILIFGANWCHDSRALAGWFATPRFAAMLAAKYEIVWVNVGEDPGEKDRNIDIAKRFGLDGIKGTPTVLVLDSAGKPVNLDDAPKWRNAASRSEGAIYDYFAR